MTAAYKTITYQTAWQSQGRRLRPHGVAWGRRAAGVARPGARRAERHLRHVRKGRV